MKMPRELQASLADESTPKFMVTTNAEGTPNCVPVTTLSAWDDETLIFGEFLMNKTRRNLYPGAPVAVSVMTRDLIAWRMTGTFTGFETMGDAVERINRSRLFRYNAYTSIRAAGWIRVDGVYTPTRVRRFQMTAAYAHARLAASLAMTTAPSTIMPPRVVEKFNRLGAVRAVGWRGTDDRPETFATMTAIAGGAGRVVLAGDCYRAHERELPINARVAVCVITPEPVAYQVKGKYLGRRYGAGFVELDACYSASPPLCGERLGAAAE